MSRILGRVLCSGIVGVLCSGCSEEAGTAGSPAGRVASATAASRQPANLAYEDVIGRLAAQGRVIGEATETYAKMMGAEEGWRVDIDGHPFEVYVFDVQSHEGQLAFDKVKNEGIFGCPAETYGNLAFFRSMKDPHPEFLTLVESIRDAR